MKKISDRLKEARGDLSQVAAARKVGISQQAWARYESNGCSPNVESLIPICRAFGVSADWLLGLSDRRDGGVTVVPDPALVEKVDTLTAENTRLKADLLRLEGEVTALNRALSLLSRS